MIGPKHYYGEKIKEDYIGDPWGLHGEVKNP
jgi:hypothetical protein